MKTILLLSIFIISSFALSAQSIGPNSPLHATESVSGCLACPGSDWTNPANAELNDGTNATCGMTAGSTGTGVQWFSRYLEVSKFGFNVPLTATISGIVVDIKRNVTGSVTSFGVKDSVVQLMTAVGTMVGANKKSAVSWIVGSAYTTYGTATDTWSYGWTPAMINDSVFGVALMVQNKGTAILTANVDHIRVTVYYTMPTGINELYSQTSDVTVFPNPATNELRITNYELGIKEVSIYNVLGEIVYQEAPDNNQSTINITQLNKGIYFIQTKDNAGKILLLNL